LALPVCALSCKGFLACFGGCWGRNLTAV